MTRQYAVKSVSTSFGEEPILEYCSGMKALINLDRGENEIPFRILDWIDTLEVTKGKG